MRGNKDFKKGGKLGVLKRGTGTPLRTMLIWWLKTCALVKKGKFANISVTLRFSKLQTVFKAVVTKL